MTLRTLHLYGDLAKTYGKKHTVASAVMVEALRIVDCNHPGFLRRVHRGQFHCLRGAKTLKGSSEMHPHHVIIPVEGDLHLIPVATGAKSRTAKIIFSVIVGGALLATGIGGALAPLASGGGFGGGAVALGVHLGVTYGTVALMGAGLLLGGISMLLTPVPKDPGERKPTSFTFDGPLNAGNEGGPIPLLYGELIVGGVTIASDISSSASGYNAGGTATGGILTSGMNIGGTRSNFSYVNTV